MYLQPFTHRHINYHLLKTWYWFWDNDLAGCVKPIRFCSQTVTKLLIYPASLAFSLWPLAFYFEFISEPVLYYSYWHKDTKSALLLLSESVFTKLKISELLLEEWLCGQLTPQWLFVEKLWFWLQNTWKYKLVVLPSCCQLVPVNPHQALCLHLNVGEQKPFMFGTSTSELYFYNCSCSCSALCNQAEHASCIEALKQTYMNWTEGKFSPVKNESDPCTTKGLSNKRTYSQKHTSLVFLSWRWKSI